MDKPIHLGISILDITITKMNEFYYEYIKAKYQNRTKLCYTMLC